MSERALHSTPSLALILEGTLDGSATAARWPGHAHSAHHFGH